MLPIQALRSPLVAAVISHLQHAAFTLPWTVRVAAVQALAKARTFPSLLLCPNKSTAVRGSALDMNVTCVLFQQ